MILRPGGTPPRSAAHSRIAPAALVASAPAPLRTNTAGHPSGASAVTIGVPFTLRVLGTFLRDDDRYRVVPGTVVCGSTGAASNQLPQPTPF